MPVEREWVRRKLEKRIKQGRPKGEPTDNRQAVKASGAREVMPHDGNVVFVDITGTAILPGD